MRDQTRHFLPFSIWFVTANDIYSWKLHIDYLTWHAELSIWSISLPNWSVRELSRHIFPVLSGLWTIMILVDAFLSHPWVVWPNTWTRTYGWWIDRVCTYFRWSICLTVVQLAANKKKLTQTPTNKIIRRRTVDVQEQNYAVPYLKQKKKNEQNKSCVCLFCAAHD